MKPDSGVSTPAQYLASLPADRRKEIATVREMLNRHMPTGYVESFRWGMLSWEIPLARYPDTYNKQPLMYVALASQKNDCGLYLTGYALDAGRMASLKKAFTEAGKKLDMGKSCLHFKTADDLPLPALGKLIAAVPVDMRIEIFEASRPAAKPKKAANKGAVKKAITKKSATKKAATRKVAAPAKRANKK